ncbi:hypothetical protein N9E30_02955 [Flavobacteriales bacterium]|nr:hypothetical protein [Flavobacteriales bacterium]
MKRIFCLLIMFNGFVLSAQESIVKSVMLDSVMVSAVSSGFSVEEFIHYVKTDTSFYQGFKNLRYYPHTYKSELEVFNAKNKSIGFLARDGHYEVTNNRLVVKIDSAYNDGKIYNRRGKYKYYTPEFFDYIFFPEDTITVSKYSSSDDEGESESTNDKNEKDAKVIVFNPGSVEVEKSGSKKEKLAVFDVSMQKYYDYIISQKTYKDTLDCYEFVCRMKTDLSEKEEEEVLIRELVSYFDRNTFNVVYRKYVMQYNYWLIDLNVTVDAEMDYAEDQLIPSFIHYKGYWDIPFSKPEVAEFKLWNSDFIIKD